MSRKIALKRLSHSDLKLFKVYFDLNKAGRQKGINLNADVLIDNFYPNLPSPVKVGLVINGPGITTTPDLHIRHIARPKGGKNRRLQATVIPNPAGTDRYTPLAVNDLALMEFFDGPEDEPESIAMTLISAAVVQDEAAFRALTGLVQLSQPGNKKTMVALSPATLESRLSGVLPTAHPLRLLLTSNENELELLVQGGDVESGEVEVDDASVPPVQTPTRLPAILYKPRDFNKTAKPSLSSISAEVLAESKASATANGEAGKGLVNLFLKKRLTAGGYEWSSRKNAIAPYDFELTNTMPAELIDVKTTIGSFDAPFHLSLHELRQAACAPGPYRIYRVYDIKGKPRLRVSGDIREFASGLFTYAQALPPGIIADGFTLKPRLLVSELDFGAEIVLPATEE
jgi:hypothetical protein